LLSAWGVPSPSSLQLEIHTDRAIENSATIPFPPGTILCHITTSNQKKEWPPAHWARLYESAVTNGLALFFSAGRSAREQRVLAEIKRLIPSAPILPPDPDLATFLVWLKQAQVVIAGDTGPLHFAAGLGVPTISLFGSSLAKIWAPVGKSHVAMQGAACTCPGDADTCLAASSCIAAITPEMVLTRLKEITAVRGP
jgi:ADP-heptose:LPS heptosyltransferase